MNREIVFIFQRRIGMPLLYFFLLIGTVGMITLIGRILGRAAIITGAMAGILFLAAGTLNWPEAWILTSIYGLFVMAFMAWGFVFVPDLMRERGQMAGNAKRWDKIINLAFTASFVAVLIVAGLDARHSWSDLHIIVQAVGILGIVLAGVIILLTLMSNTFLSRWARIQDDRGHGVVSQGPYQFVRHPMYEAIILFILCTPFELDSPWSLIPAALGALIYVARTSKEDQMLQDELDGYREYAGTVRYRLLPGVW